MSVLAETIQIARSAPDLGVCGRVESVTGMTVQAAGLPVPVGSVCLIGGDARTARDGATGGFQTRVGGVPAEVIGFRGGLTMLMALKGGEGLAQGQRVRFVTSSRRVAMGPGLLGRVIDGMGRPCDGGPDIAADVYYDLDRPPPDPLKRTRIQTPLSVGIRSINALLTPGGGGRLGIFAGTGVGKSVLLGMMARYTSADVSVVALIGERGREVGDFLAKELGPQGLKRSVVVCSTSDQSPLLRVRACFVATAVAEYFRDRGANVLLLMDSATRMAMAQRQIGLAAGEPPATKGYPPSVFALLPKLMERSGRTADGSITGLYTVLVEGDDLNDPIGDAVRGILDGHIWLSRRVAGRGQYPAVSVLDSISRLMPDVTDAAHLEAAALVRRLLSIWTEIEDLVNIGAYAAGTNPEFDLVIRTRPMIEAFLRQKMDEQADFAASRAALMTLAGDIEREKTKISGGKK